MRFLTLMGALKDFISDSDHNIVAEIFMNNSIRINNYQCRANKSENFITLVSLNQVVQNFGLIQDIHITHIIISLSL